MIEGPAGGRLFCPLGERSGVAALTELFGGTASGRASGDLRNQDGPLQFLSRPLFDNSLPLH